MQVTEGYKEFCDFLEKHSGICLGPSKQYLVASRLRSIAQAEGVDTLKELLDLMLKDYRGKLKSQIVDAMTTNETLWFRDMHPFEIFRNRLLPEFYASKPSQPMRIWSAACSTGQEPYSLSMVIEEFKRTKPGVMHLGNERIMATDISQNALSEAKAGEYAMLALGRGLDPARLKQYFTQTSNDRWKIKPEIAKRVEFRSLNLSDSYSLLGQFDVIFCRNVLIYFTAELKEQILRKMAASLKPNGYLIVGASEAVNGLSDLYEMVHCRPGIIYKKKAK